MLDNTKFDKENYVCILCKEIVALTQSKTVTKEIMKLIRSKVKTIRKKAQKMENRLIDYRNAIEGLGFKRTKDLQYMLKTGIGTKKVNR